MHSVCLSLFGNCTSVLSMKIAELHEVWINSETGSLSFIKKGEKRCTVQFGSETVGLKTWRCTWRGKTGMGWGQVYICLEVLLIC